MESNNYFGLPLKDKEEYLERRKGLLDCKQSIISLQFAELLNVINISQFTRRYFNKDQSWFSQKLHNCTVLNKTRCFTEEEAKVISLAFRDLANQLITYADEIDNAKDCERQV